jgi:ABC-type transport system substrate-binding protein
MDPPSLAAKAKYGSEDVQLIMFVTGFNMSPSSFRNAYLPNGSYNRQTYDNPVVTELYNKAAGTTDKAEREKIYRELQEIVAKDPPIVNAFWRLNGIVAVNSIGGMHLPPDVYYDLRYIYQLVD